MHGQIRGNRIPCRAQHSELFSICSLTTRAPRATNVPRDSPDPLLPGHLQPTEGRHPGRHIHIHADRAPAPAAGIRRQASLAGTGRFEWSRMLAHLKAARKAASGNKPPSPSFPALDRRFTESHQDPDSLPQISGITCESTNDRLAYPAIFAGACRGRRTLPRPNGNHMKGPTT